MPVTLGCPNCGKRFKARDESAGKRVKCPYCGTAVTVPTTEEAAAAGAPTMAIPPTPVPPRPSPLAGAGPRPTSGPKHPPAPPVPTASPAEVATPDDWGAEPPRVELPPAPPRPIAEPPPTPLPLMPKVGERPRVLPKSAAADKSDSADSRTAEQENAPGWKRARDGLGWAQFALFLMLIPGSVGLAKIAFPRAGVEIPKGEGWSIPGYMNSPEPTAVKMRLEEQIEKLALWAPVVLAGLLLGFGRLRASGVPGRSGANGMFALSGLFTLAGFGCAATAIAASQLNLDLPGSQLYHAGLIGVVASEVWFLVAIGVSGAALKRPEPARAVGFLVFALTIAALVEYIGWQLFIENVHAKIADDDWLFHVQVAATVGWWFLVLIYWRAVGKLRRAIRDHLEWVGV